MPSPLLQTKSSGAAPALTETAKDLFRAVYQSQQGETAPPDGENVSTIKVNEIISKMSFFYEKIRNAVDYKDEHLLRKNATERILRRLNLMGHSDETEVARMLLVELIRAGYLRNGFVRETKVGDIAGIISRFVRLRRLLTASENMSRKDSDAAHNWVMNLAATEIEESLGDHRVDQVIGQHMFDIINDNIIDDGDNAEFTRDKKIQIYLAIFSKLFKYDDAMLEFLLFRYIHAQWQKAGDSEIELIAQNAAELRQLIARQLTHPFRKQVGRIAARYTIYFSILRDVVEENPEHAYDKLKDNPAQFKKLVEKFCERRYRESRGRLRRGAVRSIVYLFLTKSILVFILEAPVIIFLGDELRYPSLIINILFPPTLLFLISLFTSVPKQENTAKIQAGIDEIVFDRKKNDHTVRLRYPTARTAAANLIFGFLYAVTFMFSFGLVIWGLVALQFNIVSIIVFLLFLSFVSFFGIRISRNVAVICGRLGSCQVPRIQPHHGHSFLHPVSLPDSHISQLTQTQEP